MSRNKKIAMVVVCIALGVTMLLATTLTSMASTSGYEAYKAAVKNTVAVKSVTSSVKMTLKDNGKTLSSVDSVSKTENSDRLMSTKAAVKIGDQEKNMEMYAQDGKLIMKSSDSEVYKVVTEDRNKKMRRDREGMRYDRVKGIEEGEKLVDAVVGNLKNYVSADVKADGTSEISMQLSGNQVPAVANILTSIGMKAAAQENFGKYHRNPGFDYNFAEVMPKLVDDIRIDNVDLKAKTNKDGMIEKQTADIVIRGNDSQGKTHELVIRIDAEFAGMNGTHPDTVDLTGKQVETVNPEKD